MYAKALDGEFEDYQAEKGPTKKLLRAVEGFKEELHKWSVLDTVKIAEQLKEEKIFEKIKDVEPTDSEGMCIEGRFSFKGENYYFYYNYMSEQSFEYQCALDIMSAGNQ